MPALPGRTALAGPGLIVGSYPADAIGIGGEAGKPGA